MAPTNGPLFRFTGQGGMRGDVSAFAGQNVELKLTIGDIVGGTADHGLLDDITFVTAPRLSISGTVSGIVIEFTGTLQSADALAGPWTDVTGASPITISASGPMKFYRARQ